MIYMFLSNSPSSGDINSSNLSCFFCEGGGLPENNPDIFLVLNFNILHFTVIERRSRIRACPYSSARVILGGGVLIYFYTYE